MALGVLLPSGYEIIEDNNGATVPGGLVWTYLAGTTTPQATYQDAALTVLNGNPIVTGPTGSWTAYVPASASYKLVLEAPPTAPNIHGATIKTIDNASGPVFSGQLQFPATQVPSSDPNVLDDYEEGSWTPTILGTGQTYGQQQGLYVKVGKLVTVWFIVLLSNKGTITGGVGIGGLPFATTSSAASGCVGYIGALALPISSPALIVGGTVSLTLVGIPAGGLVSENFLDTTYLTNALNLQGQASYVTSS